ncbi:HNH endonuclease [Gemmatimonadota bacterium]
MPDISEGAVRDAYSLALSVYDGELSFSTACQTLTEKHGMNKNSAADYVGNVRKLLGGLLYKRTINLSATEYYLDRIFQDFGLFALATALDAVDQHIEYYESVSNARQLRLRGVRDHWREKLGSEIPEIEKTEGYFSRALRHSASLSAEKRYKRIRQSRKIPIKVKVTTSVFARSPDVVAEVLHRANGYCESCGQPAPFSRASDGSPYLEVHHLITLSEGGEDTPENAQALCPNCHRKAHYG